MTEKRKPNFVRRDSPRFSRLGKKRKNKQIWRRPTGRDNKMREKRSGYPAVVSIGYKTDNVERGKIDNKDVVIVNNIQELAKVKKNEIVSLGRVGKKKKIEIAQKAKESGIKIHNLNVERFLKRNELKKPKTVKTEKKK